MIKREDVIKLIDDMIDAINFSTDYLSDSDKLEISTLMAVRRRVLAL